MALAAIQDILSNWPGWATLALSYGDETSGKGSGRVLVKELREPYWALTAISKTLTPNEMRATKALVEGLSNGKNLFYGYDMSACYPILYPDGSWPTGISFDGISAGIESIGGDGTSLALNGLPVGFKLSVGDMLSFVYGGSDDGLSLHQVVETATAGSDGKTAIFEVRPNLPFGAVAGDVVRVKNPRCYMMIVPGSMSATTDVSGWGQVSFKAVQVKVNAP